MTGPAALRSCSGSSHIHPPPVARSLTFSTLGRGLCQWRDCSEAGSPEDGRLSQDAARSFTPTSPPIVPARKKASKKPFPRRRWKKKIRAEPHPCPSPQARLWTPVLRTQSQTQTGDVRLAHAVTPVGIEEQSPQSHQPRVAGPPALWSPLKADPPLLPLPRVPRPGPAQQDTVTACMGAHDRTSLDVREEKSRRTPKFGLEESE